MTTFWVDLRHVPVNKRLPYLAALRKAPVDAMLVASGDPYVDKQGVHMRVVDGRRRVLADKKPIGKWVKLRHAADQKRAISAKGLVVVECADWRVIPLENLIAARQSQPETLFVHASTLDDVRLFAHTLQVGPHGIVFAPQSPSDLSALEGLRSKKGGLWEVEAADPQPTDARRPASATAARDGAGPTAMGAPGPRDARGATPNPTGTPLPIPAPAGPREVAPDSEKSAVTPAAIAASQGHEKGPTDRPSSAPSSNAAPARPTLRLEEAEILSVRPVDVADRVAVDTASRLEHGEGLLVGATAASLCLVFAETAKTAFLAPRPFRVNAGALLNYVLLPNGTTRYLCELVAGDRVLVYAVDGSTREAVVGRVKIETRPHLLIKWRSGNVQGHVLLQNAETVTVAGPGARRIPVAELRSGSRILVSPQPAARHAGTAVAMDVVER